VPEAMPLDELALRVLIVAELLSRRPLRRATKELAGWSDRLGGLL
jgi:hypothetical protein